MTNKNLNRSNNTELPKIGERYTSLDNWVCADIIIEKVRDGRVFPKGYSSISLNTFWNNWKLVQLPKEQENKRITKVDQKFIDNLQNKDEALVKGAIKYFSQSDRVQEALRRVKLNLEDYDIDYLKEVLPKLREVPHFQLIERVKDLVNALESHDHHISKDNADKEPEQEEGCLSHKESIWKDIREARKDSLIFIDIDGMYSYPVRFDGENYISDETGEVLTYQPKKYTCASEIIKHVEQTTKETKQLRKEVEELKALIKK